MDNLLAKIKSHTFNGPPNVTELIELQEMARALKVSRVSLEKMISEAIASQPEIDTETKNTSDTDNQRADSDYKRPDFDSARNSFDLEMNQRREEETFSERKEIEFNRPEIVFPEMEDPFAREEKIDAETEAISESSIADEIAELNKETEALETEAAEEIGLAELRALEEQKKQTASFEKARLEAEENYKREIEYEKKKFAEEERVRKEETSSTQGLESILTSLQGSAEEEVEEDSVIELESFEIESEPASQVKSAPKEGVEAWIANSNEEELRRVQELSKRKATQKKETTPPEQERSFSRDNKMVADSRFVRMTKSAFALGIVALVVSVLFGFVGAIIGFFGLRKSNEGLRGVKLTPQLFEKGALSKLKNARTLSVIAIVIGVFKFARIFFLPYYYF